MNRSRSLALALAAALAVTGAACGGAAKSGAVGAAGTSGKGAEAMPASTLAFIDANADTSSAAWTKVRAVGARVPGWAKLEAQVTQALAGAGTDGKRSFAAGIAPWLGNEVAAGVLGVTLAGGKPALQVVVYAASTDDAKLAAAIATGSKKSGTYKGYTEFAPSNGDGVAAVGKSALLYATDATSLEAAIDAREGADSLAASSLYADTLAKLPADNVVVGYVDGAKVANLLQMAAGLLAGSVPGAAVDPLKKAIEQAQAIRAVGMSLGADANGIRLQVVESVDPSRSGSLPAGGKVTLVDRAPADSAVFADTTALGAGIAGALQTYRSLPAFGRAESQVMSMTGLSLEKDVLPLLSGEAALYVAGTTPPSGGLILKPADATRGAATMRQLTAAVGTFKPALAFKPLSGGADGESVTSGGREISWVRDGDILAVGLGTAGTAPTGGLTRAPRFSRAAADAGLPGSVSGLAYLDPAGIAGLVPAGADRRQRQARDAVAALGGLIAWTTGSGGEMTLTVYLDVPAGP